MFQRKPAAGGAADVLVTDERQMKLMGLGCKEIVERKIRMVNTNVVTDIFRGSREHEPRASAKMLGAGSQGTPPRLTNHPEIKVLQVGAASLLGNDGQCICWKISPIRPHFGCLQWELLEMEKTLTPTQRKYIMS